MFVTVSIFIVLAIVVVEGRKDNRPYDESKHIKCEICPHIATAIATQLETSLKKADETEIVDYLDSICMSSKSSGEWIRELDIQEKDGHLVVEKPGGVAMCGSECKTVERACNVLMYEDMNLDDLSLNLWQYKKAATAPTIYVTMCQHITLHCVPDRVVYTVKDRVDEPFISMSHKEQDMEALMNNMKESGLGKYHMLLCSCDIP
jgi:hypothetical protein